MRYLSGCLYNPCAHWEHGGLMFTPEMGNIPNLSGVYWGADNGCYTAGAKFSPERWLRFLRRWQDQGTCLFAVAPDVPFDMASTLDRSLPYLAVIRSMGYRASLAIQNGVANVPLPWDDFDAVFIAGTKDFKTSSIAYAVIREAKRRGKFVHIARRNSKRAVQEAYDMGADSVDGTFLKYAPDFNWERMQRWFRDFCQHPSIDYWDRAYGVCVECRSPVWRERIC